MTALTLERLLDDARTARDYLPTPVPDDTLRRLYEHVKFGPTSANCGPMRLVFVRSAEGKARLAACVSPGNVAKVQAAPVTAIVGMDLEFYEHLPRLHPHGDARSWFAGKPAHIETTALRNSSLQGGYLILAARALGLDAGPMSGFDAAKMDAAFWAGSTVRTNFICALGHADVSRQHPRAPRLAFDEACRFE